MSTKQSSADATVIRSLIEILRAFMLGMIEFRSDLTTHFDGDQIETYDRGRDLMHALTLRRYDKMSE